MHPRHRILLALAALSLIIFFIFLRLYKIETSLLFLIDMGRDFAEMEEWRRTGIPPLLGPQTSALSFNQSAVYFYLLYPGYILSGLSPFSSEYTLVVVYCALFLIGIVYFWKKRAWDWLWALLILFTLITLQPQAIIQNRFVWNPSFAFPGAIVALMSWLWAKKEWSLGAVIVWGIASAFAVSMSYSTATLLIALLALTPVVFGVRNLRGVLLWASSAVAMVLINAPTLVFELRHQFTLTYLMIYGQKQPQVGLSMLEKSRSLLSLLGGVDDARLALIIVAAFLLSIIAGLILLHKRQQFPERNRLALTTGIFFLTVGLTYALPVSIHSHYIFGLLAAAVVVAGFLPKHVGIAFTLLVATIWLQPQILLPRFQPASRTVAEMQSCFAQVCAEQGSAPLYVSTEASFHPFHFGPEHRYFLDRAGCVVKNIETQPNTAQHMAVIVDGDVTYEHNKTAYNELTLFGPSQVKKRFDCTEKFKVVLLESVSSATTTN